MPIFWVYQVSVVSELFLDVLSLPAPGDDLPARGGEALTLVRPPELGLPLYLMLFLSPGFSKADTPRPVLAQGHYVSLMKLWGSRRSSGACESGVLAGFPMLVHFLQLGEEKAPISPLNHCCFQS